ncbi:BspA family leucine-rich repeat surface protein [Chryseobacterium sp.]|uniref:BspA family leucine-rich repeat surface protein n=1 Tax=Chryseobacterium sp. TaxID=1871047 RepID=UPI00289DCA21|nr:BspA family leucine-rich repeat surface protein [Chryseobacterium sp.]
MIKKVSIFIILLSFLQVFKAQNEFITIWKPNLVTQLMPVVPQFTPAAENQIWFPGIGQNYTISWEEIGYPQHNGTMTNVTSTMNVLIDFGTSLNPNSADATYRVKVSNGNGSFKQIKFSEDAISTIAYFDVVTMKALGSSNKIVEIEQWGNTQWQSMKSAFSQCGLLEITATDTPDLSKVTDASLMFYNTFKLNSNPAFANWNTSNVENFKYMFGRTTPPSFLQNVEAFDAPVGSWNMSSATDISYMFFKRKLFNQNLNGWDTSNVTNMGYTFAEAEIFNQPLDNWNTSKVTNMGFMFHFIPNFNQPLNTWDTSKVTDMGHMFHLVSSFDQPLDMWDVSKVTEMNTMFGEASSFNHTLKDWKLSVLMSAIGMIRNTGLDCGNYSSTLYGWANNPTTANNINLGINNTLKYSQDATTITSRNTLLNTKGWIFSGDTAIPCERLSTSEYHLHDLPSIYPNPAKDIIFIKNIQNAKNYLITDMSGRIVDKDVLDRNFINVELLTTGNYILQIVSKDKIHSFKFIKK